MTCPKQKTCDEQGVCQALQNCPQCRAPYPFAPGVIDGPAEYMSISRTETLALSVLVLFFFMTLLVILGIIFGCINLLELPFWMGFR